MAGPLRRRWDQELRLPSLFFLMRNPRFRRLHPRRLLLLALRRLRVLLKATGRKFLPSPVQQFLSVLIRATPLLVTTMKVIPVKRLLALVRQLIVALASNTKHIPAAVHHITPILTAVLVGVPNEHRTPTISPQLPQTARQQLTLAMISGLKVLATTPLQLMIEMLSSTEPAANNRSRLLTMVPSVIPLLVSANAMLSPEQSPSPPPTIPQRLFATLQQLMVLPALAALLLLTSEQPEPPPSAEELLPITKALYSTQNHPISTSNRKPKVKPLSRHLSAQEMLEISKPQANENETEEIHTVDSAPSLRSRISPHNLLATTQQQVTYVASNIIAKPQQLLTSTRNLISSTHEQLRATAKYIPTSPQ